MRIVRFKNSHGLSWGVVKQDGIVDVGAIVWPDRGAIHSFLSDEGLERLEEFAAGRPATHALEKTSLAPFLPDPEKIICVGVNYHDSNTRYRMGGETLRFPSLFTRAPSSFTGSGKPLIRPRESDQFDYEGEIAIVIGRGGRRIPRDRALNHIAGLTIVNDGSARDWMRHCKLNIMQGKNFDRSGSIGPWMVTADEFNSYDELSVQTRVNGELRQDGNSDNMLFPFDYLIEYISSFATLQPGDIISTGTPPGIGDRMEPPVYLQPGDVVEVTVPGIGTLRNEVVDE